MSISIQLTGIARNNKKIILGAIHDPRNFDFLPNGEIRTGRIDWRYANNSLFNVKNRRAEINTEKFKDYEVSFNVSDSRGNAKNMCKRTGSALEAVLLFKDSLASVLNKTLVL
ncbi:MAG TPA: hypothetical protein HA306_06540 [Methanosarcina sp.]|nr:hypothetical protein [Methanosarcina sp.]